MRLFECWQNGYTCLHLASSSCHSAIIEYLCALSEPLLQETLMLVNSVSSPNKRNMPAPAIFRASYSSEHERHTWLQSGGVNISMLNVLYLSPHTTQ
jgi:hypothetical protein